MNERDFAELAAGHALHALSAADERRFAAALAQHPEWRELADDDGSTAARLADALEPVQAPPALRAALLARIGDHPQGSATADAATAADAVTADAVAKPDAAAVAAPASAAPRRWSRAVLALAACLVLLVGGGIATAVVVSQLQRPASVVALDEIRSAPDAQQATVRIASGARATAHWSGSLGEAVLVTSGLDHPGADRTYELWFVRGETPVSAGVFDTVDGRATAVLKGTMHAGDAIAVTVERAGGSPSGAPTTEPLIVIPTA